MSELSNGANPGSAAGPLLSVRSLSKHFEIRSRGFFSKTVGMVRAVEDVSFDLQPGETLGLVGESGSGKTTVARCIMRALQPTSGQILFQTAAGSIVDLATLGERSLKALRPQAQMIFQDPFSSLNPRMTVGQIVAEPLVVHGLTRRSEIDGRVVDILSRVGLKPDHRTRYPHAFSGGQRQRIGIARALIMRPSLVIADEATSALDVSVQAQVLNLLKDLQREFRLTFLFVAHNLDVVRHFCDRVAVMYAGRVVELGRTSQIFSNPLHPYTRALMAAVPWPDPDVKMNFDVPGEVADPTRLPSGCSFHPRCPRCFAPCPTVRPDLRDVDGTGRFAACHLHDPAYAPESGEAKSVSNSNRASA
ncbi:MAG TPA: oligopeptide/dipeptide ABC transporter ATP-binding protein [Opitutaceae bacterium]|nr:oligopeptide/dipeptide ABC transporter ATP-binding protein [Opitutaceae bacterium]